MSSKLSRRTVLTAAAAFAAAPLVPQMAAGQGTLQLTATRRVLDVDGRAASVFGITNATGGQGLILNPGQRFSIQLTNATEQQTLIHWHGQIPPHDQDGVPGLPMPALMPGGARSYEFSPQPGTHWMHSHIPVQEMGLLAAPLIVRSAQDLIEDRQEVVMFLHDFSFRDPQEILEELLSGMAGHDMAGHEMPAPVEKKVDDHVAIGHSGNGHTGVDKTTKPKPTKAPAPKPSMDLNDIDFDAYLTNDRTLSDPEVIAVAHKGRIRLRIINAAAATTFWIDTGIAARAVAVDGQPIAPMIGTRFGLAMAQRIDLDLDLPGSGVFPILALREGARERTGLILATPGQPVPKIAAKADQAAPAFDLDMAQEAALQALVPLTARRLDRVHDIQLGGAMKPYVWTIDDKTWSARRPIEAVSGERVHLTFHNASRMGHPMHLHGHVFQIVNINGRSINGAVRDTVYVPPDARVTVALDAGQAARWMLHCHQMPHLASGMMTEFAVTA